MRFTRFTATGPSPGITGRELTTTGARPGIAGRSPRNCRTWSCGAGRQRACVPKLCQKNGVLKTLKKKGKNEKIFIKYLQIK